MEEQKYLDKIDDDLWTTKGARFVAHSRLLRKSQISNITISILSSYLIIIGLTSVFDVNENRIDANLISFFATSISVLVLVFSQIEYANDYKVRANHLHTCALEISDLLRKVKNFKGSIDLQNPRVASSILEFCEAINSEYSLILKKYENHKTLDYNKLKLQHKKDFGVNWFDSCRYWLIYNFDIYFLYLLFIFSPLIAAYLILN